MDKFNELTAAACPIDIANLNTDQLLPARFLKLPRSAGLGKFLLQDLRCDAQGNARPDFPLNRPAWRAARILVGRRNHAYLTDFGFTTAGEGVPSPGGLVGSAPIALTTFIPEEILPSSA